MFPYFFHAFLILKPFFKPSISDVKVSSDSGLFFSATFGHSSSGLGQSFRMIGFHTLHGSCPHFSHCQSWVFHSAFSFATSRAQGFHRSELFHLSQASELSIYFWNPGRCKTWFCFTESCWMLCVSSLQGFEWRLKPPFGETKAVFQMYWAETLQPLKVENKQEKSLFPFHTCPFFFRATIPAGNSAATNKDGTNTMLARRCMMHDGRPITQNATYSHRAI